MDNKDLEVLIEKLKNITDGDLKYSKAEEFDNPEIATVLNGMINAFAIRNNHYLMRINDSMYKIADSSCVKAMLDEIATNKEPIKVMEESVEFLLVNKEDNKTGSARVYALSKQVKCWIEEFTSQCDDMDARLSAVLEKGKLNKSVAGEISEIAEELRYMRQEIGNASVRVNDMNKDLGKAYKAAVEQDEYYTKMFKAMNIVTGSFETLYADCLKVGEHLYRISRDIDNARNDMFRKNSWPLLHDKLKVFSADHFTLTWRLYNHAVEYETLRVAQVDSPDTCKFGTWAQKEIQRGSDLSKTPEFKAVVDAHYEFHKYAVESFLNKESYKDKEAIESFEKAFMTYAKFDAAIDDLHRYLNSIGILDETEVWKFKEENNVRQKI